MIHFIKRIQKNGYRMSLRTSLFFVLFIMMPAFSSSLKENIEQYFVDLWQDFDKIAASSSIKKTSLSYVDRYFVSMLKKNQTFYTFIKTNSKGVLINEVVRGEKTQRKFRDVGTQRWYTFVSKKHRDYHGFLRDENGRYYLFWAKPVLKMTRSGRKTFVGAVALKIDFWDCFHKIAEDIDEPFLIRLGRKSLYSNKWKKGPDFKENTLEISGVKRVSVRFVESDTAQTPTDSPTFSIAEDSLKEEVKSETKIVETKTKIKTEPKKPPAKRFSKTKKIIFIILFFAIILLVLYIFKLMVVIKDRRLRNMIDKEDKLPK